MNDITPLDGAVLAILIVAVLRGAWKGLIGEGFSIAVLAGTFIAVRLFNPTVASWLVEVTNGQIGSMAAPWIAGAGIVAGTAAIIGVLGRSIRRGARAVGLGWADRLGGSVLGAAEGALVAGLLVVASTWVAGDHPIVTESHSLEALEMAQAYVSENRDRLPDVAAGSKGD